MKHTKTLMLALAVATMTMSGWAVGQPVPAGHRTEPPIAMLPPPPLLRITDAQAQPVRLAAMKVDVRVVGRLARSTVELTFQNPNGRILEGELQFPLLDGQQVTAFALDFDGKWRNSVPVEKAVGQQVFEEVTRTRVDPALLEATQGNNFKLRLYPIPANGERKVSITLTERLPVGRDGKAALRLPVAASERLKSFEFHLAAPGLTTNQARVLQGLSGAAWKQSPEGLHLDFQRQDYQPAKLLEIALDLPAKPVTVMEEMDGQPYFYAELTSPRSDKALRPKPAQLALVWDASGSGATRDHGREFALLDAYFKDLGDTQVNLLLARHDAQAEAAGSFTVHGGDWSALRTVLEQVAYDGATNPGAFLPAEKADTVLLFTDGLGNFGTPAMPRFTVPVLAVSASATADLPRLRHAAQTSGGVAVDLMRTAPDKAALLLREAAPRILSLRSNGARQLVASEPDGEGRVAVAGILSEFETTVDVEWLGPSGKHEKQTLKLTRSRAMTGFAAQQWARLRIDELEPEYALNKAEIQRLGKGFGLVTRATSLIVLDRVEDYVRYDIAPPVELRADFDRLRSNQRQQLEKDKATHLEDVVRRFKERQTWWDKDFPKGDIPKPKVDVSKAMANGSLASDAVARPSESRITPAPSPVASPAPMSAMAPAPSPAPVMAKMASGGETAAALTSIQLKKWVPDAPYAERLRKADKDQLYRVYLDERPGYLNSTAFYLDAADIFFDRGEPQLALRILSNLAEMNLENRAILRILGYRLLQAKQADLAVMVLERVLELAPQEPQSYRDLGLALAAAGQQQKAIDLLNEVVTRPWHGRFPDIELVALGELNAVVATAPEKLDTSAIDPRLLRNLPLDLRVVLSWDADNTDIDLWVTDPNGEKVFYSHTLSYQGGRISRDFTGGYGPEEFILKSAKPGKYLVQAQFYGHRQQVVSGATTLQLHLFTAFGTALQQDQSVSLRLKSGKEVVTVGEFVVGERDAMK
jgi:tetratricopeptide (TPR) repeat protein